eukprot:403342911
MVVTYDLRDYGTFWEDVYMCQNPYDCLTKYVIGGISLLFVLLYAQAYIRISRKRTVDLDYILLFIIRVIKMLEQVTICLILIEMTTKKIPLMRTFWLTLTTCVISVMVMIFMVVYMKTYSFLYEKSQIWIIISVFQAMISLVTLVLTLVLFKRDPLWQQAAEGNKEKFKLVMRRSSVGPKNQRQILDFSLESFLPQDRLVRQSSNFNNNSLNGMQDVQGQFKKVYQEQLVIRRSKLFLLMIFSVMTIGIMLALDIYVYVFLQNYHGHDFGVLNIAIIIIGRILQYHSVNLFLYFFLYWPYRRTFQPKQNNFDVSYISELEVNDISLIKQKEALTEKEQQQQIKNNFAQHNQHTKSSKTPYYGKSTQENENSYAL